jgi:hypothetical protein
MDLDKKLLDDTVQIGEGLLMIAEEFNPIFASRGWIACNAINTEAAALALEAAAAGLWNDADNILAAAYSPAMVRIQLRHLGKLRCFANRLELGMLAVEDYEADRFHACIPVTLALLDGMGQELTGANFFRNTRRIKAKESFLEIGPGVAELLRVMSETRNTTTSTPIDIPFRHGILHGTDLGYNNRIVAAKAWAALLAIGHYASDYVAPVPGPSPTLIDTLRRSAEVRRRIDAMEAAQGSWLPRSRGTLDAIIAEKKFAHGTPEEAAAAVLKAWQTKKFGVIAQNSSDSLKTDTNSLAGKIRKILGPGPDVVDVVAIEDFGSASAVVRATLTWGDESDQITLRLLYHKDAEIAPRTMDGGRWLLASLWPLESARSIVFDQPEDGDAA